MRVQLCLALTLALAFPSAALADIEMIDVSKIQGDNVLFNDGTQTGTSIAGSTQDGTEVVFTGTTMGGADIISANGGQARIEGNSGLLVQSLDFHLAGGATFENVEFNLFNGGSTGGTSGLVTFELTDNEGQVFTFADQAINGGSNFFGFQSILGQSIANVAFTATNGFVDARQIRLGGVSVSSVPEPATWAMLLVGFGAVGGQIRRRRRTIAVKYA